MKTKLTDLNTHLFEMIERMNDDELFENPEQANLIINRAKAMTDIASQIIQVQSTQLRAIEIADKCGYTLQDIPSAIGLQIEDKGGK